MTRVPLQSSGGPLGLDAAASSLLLDRVERAGRQARRESRSVLASVTVPVPSELDLSAVALDARRRDDRFFCMEQPDRGRTTLAALGQAAVVETSGGARFAEAAAGCRERSRGALATDQADDPLAPSGAGPVWVGGFAFADEGGHTPEWSSLAPAQLVMPEVSLARRGDEARLTVTMAVAPSEAPEAALDRAAERLRSLAPASMPLVDPHPAARPRVSSAAPPEHYEEAVRRAVERIRAGHIRKVVLAREVRVHAGQRIDPAAVLGALRDVFPACYCYCVGTPELAFVGASPELLVRREAARVSTVALAGTARRSADEEVDAHLGERLRRSAKDREEQAIVARRISQALEPVAVWVAAAQEPVLVKVHNVQHLATPIRAQLAQPLPAVEVAGLLHPTPAVGGEPWERAAPLIPALEGLDRGWYAGAVGWTDLAGDGEFCVALRCALLRGQVAHLYAGDGIVRDSLPADELAETEVKLQALLQLLT